ncbi:VCBS repeat-containing protein [Algoriphagus sp. SE2]|uniref:VCBS repeat-containing protein n=1 Tax=Algoriphagus sp. SE2 TaxID=3141536 RepID=UPI0031CD78CB
MKIRTYILFLTIIFASCSNQDRKEITLFQLLSEEETGISFRNDLSYTEKVNPYTFRNFYNGAGVALADINQDGLIDIFLAGNQTSNKLYLNEGNLKFKDITVSAGLESENVWSTGVSMADINGDGLTDIFVSKSGPPGGTKRHNELFINNGDLTFSEKSASYGLNDEGLSQHAVFFDYDKDSDLDFYLLSNSTRSVGIFDLRKGQREIRDENGGNKLYRNDGDKFTDVSEEAGIYGSAIGYGLGVTVADLNADTWPDLYISNDFFERDYLYLNNQDGTFSEQLPELISELSMGSMGADIADLDNDGRPDIFVTEMLPAELSRAKTKTPFEEWDKYEANIKAGYHHQFTRNTLQRNLGFKPETNEPIFSEVSRQTGMEATDWSWGALIFDADNDGLKDVFVANGIVKDLTDFDFVDFYVNDQEKIEGFRRDSVLLTKMIDEFPSNPQQNYWFKNLGNWNFQNLADSIGLSQKTFSTGAAYGDLDNDGDLDLVINNLNDRAYIYQNNTEKSQNSNYLTLNLGQEFGAQVTCFVQGKKLYQEFQPVKGYMSSVDPRIHFGLGDASKIDSVQIRWANGEINIFKEIATNQIITFKPSSLNLSPSVPSTPKPIFTTSKNRIPFTHRESNFIDFDRDRLRFWMISNEGPKAAKGDINGDSLEDLFIPGAKGQSSALLIQQPDGSFIPKQREVFEKDSLSEDVLSHFFDANGDSHLDLIVGSGGIEFAYGAFQYKDRLYLNDGNGSFQKKETVFPSFPTGFILSEDIDQDGDIDLIMGHRSLPFAYGLPAPISFWRNDGKGNFEDVSKTLGFDFSEIGMLTSGGWDDLNGDGNAELILAGEWMPIRVFSFSQGKFEEKTEEFGFSNTSGLWNTLLIEDINGDSLPDILAGNLGLNSRLQTSPKNQLQLYINDFDQNGSLDHIMVSSDGQKAIPWLMKNTLLKQIPSLKKQLPTYASYQNKSLQELFPEDVLSKSLILKGDILSTSAWINTGEGTFEKIPLPQEVQSAPVYAIQSFQGNEGEQFLIFGGNQSKIKPELGSQMGSFSWVLKKSEENNWEVLLPEQSGIYVPGEIRDILPIKINKENHLLFLRNNENTIAFKIH